MEALAAAEEVTEIYRSLVREHPAGYLGGLGNALHNLSVRYAAAEPAISAAVDTW